MEPPISMPNSNNNNNSQIAAFVLFFFHLKMALFIRNTLRPLRLCPHKLPTALPYKLGGGGSSHLLCDEYQTALPRGRIRTGTDESDPTREQLEDLFVGRFPADCEEEVIQLSNLSHRDFRRIVNAFDTSRNELSSFPTISLPFIFFVRDDFSQALFLLNAISICPHLRYHNRDDRKPSGHVFFDRKFSKISVHLAPTFLHESAIHKIEEAVWDVIKSNVRNHDELFDLRTNAAEKRRADFTTKIPDIMISHAPDAATISSPFFLAEVGFSESYEELVKSMKFWLSGHEKIKIAFLVKFRESPRYSGKKSFIALPREAMENAERYANDRDGFKIDDSAGVLQAYGAPFVGRTTAFLEIWEQKPDSGDVVLRGERVVSGYICSALIPNSPC